MGVGSIKCQEFWISGLTYYKGLEFQISVTESISSLPSFNGLRCRVPSLGSYPAAESWMPGLGSYPKTAFWVSSFGSHLKSCFLCSLYVYPVAKNIDSDHMKKFKCVLERCSEKCSENISNTRRKI